MNFSKPENVAAIIENLKDAETKRSPNRALINSLMNGAPPYTQAECDENKIQWNVNWQEGPDLLLQAREQLENAHLSTDFAFTVRTPDAPPSKKSLIGGEITRIVNRLFKKSRPYFHTQRSKWGSVVLHGPGSQMWEDQWKWRPHFVAIGDLLLPTDTELPLEDLNHFAVRRKMTPGRLFRKTFGLPEGKRDPGWSLKTVQKVLDNYKDQNQNQNTYNWADHPEQMTELWKQNAMYYESDAVPVIWMWDFYYQEDDSDRPCWYRKILLDNDCVQGRQGSSENPIVYLYDSGKPHAESISEILHIQFIDGNNVPPFMYHSCRGLGVRLHDAVHALNRLRCQFIQKVFEDMMLLFRANDPVDRSRLDKIYLGMNYGIFPEGLSFVTRDQRYSPDPRLVEMQLANLKQLIGEGSQQYTQDIDTGTNKERTAFEVSTMLNQTTRLTGSMLNLSYLQETFAYEEICRRLTLKDSPDFETKKFQNALKTAGVPEEWIDSERWEIEPVRVLGSGNTQLEQAQATAILNIRPMLNPEAQNEVLNDYVFAMTHDPKRANRLAPIDGGPRVTDTVHDTELAFGAIMGGSMVQPKPGLIPAEVIQTMLNQMQAKVDVINQSGGVGDWQTVNGLFSAELYTKVWIMQLEQDKTMQQAVKVFTDQLGKIMNEVKAFSQRLTEQSKAENNGSDPEAMQKLAMNQAMGEMKLQQNAEKHAQKMQQTQQKFVVQQRQKGMQSVADVHSKSMQAAVEAARKAQEAKEAESEGPSEE